MEKPDYCPLCNKEVIAYYIEPHKHYFVNMPDYGGGGFVECLNCNLILSAETEEKAIAAWNRRSGK